MRRKLCAEEGASLPLTERLEAAALLELGAWLKVEVGVGVGVEVEVGAVWVGLGLRLGPFG